MAKEERSVYTVSELNLTIRTLLESEFPLVWVEGEISNFSRPSSGHMYFTLKDSNAQVRCAMFKGRNMYLRFKPQDGQHVLIRARISLYEARGEFQLIAEHMEEAGAGALQREFNELKAKLAAEGLFDEDLKRELPELPTRIGVITSPTGAAIRDVLSVLQRRFPAIPVLIYPVPVQGEGSAQKIAATLKLASKRKECDVLLLVRGGGSLEDLWSFNEEIVARAIVDCDIPVVCGVGHETDVTIADFAADVRAPTPSAAAELVSPDQDSYVQSFGYYQQRLQQRMNEYLRHALKQLQWLQQRLTLQHPLTRMQQQAQRLDDLQQRLILAQKYFLDRQRHQLQHLMARLQVVSPQHALRQKQQHLANLMQRLPRAMQQRLQQQCQRLAALSRTLHAVSPLQTLGRGYAIATNEQGKSITDSRQFEIGDIVKVRLHKGGIIGRVGKILRDSEI